MSKSLARDSQLMLLASGFSSVVNYLAGLAMVRLVAPAEYSVYASASTILLILGVVGGAALQIPLAGLLARGDRSGARRLAVIGSAVYGVLATVLAIVMTTRFSADPALVFAVAASTVVTTVGAAAAGLLQGSSPVKSIARNRVIESALRAAVTLAGALTGSVALAVGSIVVGTGLFTVLSVLTARKSIAESTTVQPVSSSVLGTAVSSTLMQGLTVLLANVAVLSVVLGSEGASVAIGGYQAMNVFTRAPFILATALTVAMFVPLARGKFETGAKTLGLYARLASIVVAAILTFPTELISSVMRSEIVWDRATVAVMAVAGFAGGALVIMSSAVLARSVSRLPIVFLAVLVPLDAVLAHQAWVQGGAFWMAVVDAAVILVALYLVGRRAMVAVPRMGSGYNGALWLLSALPLAVAASFATNTAGVVLYLVTGAVLALAAVRSPKFPKGNARALRVLHLAYEDPNQPGAGGGSVRSQEINSRLGAMGHTVIAVHRQYPGAKVRTEGNVTWVPGGTLWTRTLPGVHPFALTVDYFLGVAFGLWWLVRKYNPDVIVDDFGAPITALPLRWMTRRPVVGVAQWANAEDKAKQYRLPFHWVEKIGLRSHRQIIAVSEELAQSLRARTPRTDVSVITNGLPAAVKANRQKVTLEGFRPGKDVVFLGRLDSRQKGTDVLLDAWALAQKNGSKAHLWVLGDGPDEDALKAQAAALGITGSVTFYGRLDGDSRLDVLGAAGLVVMPSRYETFGMVACEALAVGARTLIADTDSLRAFDAYGARLVHGYDANVWADAIVAGLDDSAWARAVKSNAGAVIAAFDWDVLAAQFAEVLVNARHDAGVLRHSSDAVVSQVFPAGEATLLVGNYGNNNTGDEAILARMLDLAQDKAAITVASRNCHAVTSRHGVPSVPLTSVAGVTTWLRAKRVVVGGGGMFGPGQPLLVSILPLFLIVSHWMGKKVGFAGIGAYPGMPAVSRWLLAYAGRVAQLIVVRDEPATRVLDLPWGPKRIDLIPDSGFGLATNHTVANQLLRDAHLDPKKPLMLLSPKADPDSTVTEAMVRANAHAARVWTELGGQVAAVLLSDKGEYGLGRGASDAVLAARIFALAGVPQVALGPALDPRVAKALLGDADAVVSSRFHGLVFAAAGGSPMASLTFEEKSRALLDLHSGFDVPSTQITDDCLDEWVRATYPKNGKGRARKFTGIPVQRNTVLPVLAAVTTGVEVLHNTIMLRHPGMSIVIPSYNTDVHRLTSTVQRALQVAGPDGEVIVVDDGSTNGSAHALSSVEGNLLVLRKPNGGKGSALRVGMDAARGTWVGLVDADGQYMPEEIADLAAAAKAAHTLVAVGQRDMSTVGYSFFRLASSWAFRTWTKFWLNPGVHDTQAGIKVVAGSLIPMLSAELTENTFAIDVDLLAALSRLGVQPAVAPVTFIHDDESTVTLKRGIEAFIGVVRVARLHRRAASGNTPASLLGKVSVDVAEESAANRG